MLPHMLMMPRKYDLLLRLPFKISDLNTDSLRTFEDFYCYILSKTDEMYFGFAEILDTINMEFKEIINHKQFLSCNVMFCKALEKCCLHNWNIKDSDNKSFFIRRFSDYLDSLSTKKQADLELYYDIQKFWNVMQENKNSGFAIEFFNHLISLVKSDLKTNVHLIRIYLIMKKMGFDIPMLKLHLLPLIKGLLNTNCPEEAIVISVIPFQMTKQDVLNM